MSCLKVNVGFDGQAGGGSDALGGGSDGAFKCFGT